MKSQKATAPGQSAVDPAQVSQLVTELRGRLKQVGKPDIAAQQRRAWGEGVPSHGVKASEVHRIGLDFIRRMRTGGLALAMEFADPLLKGGNLEEGLVAAQVIASSARHITSGDFERAEPWVEALTNGQTADALAVNFISHTLSAKPSLVLKLKEWTKAASPWRRRTAISAFAPLVREGRFLTDALEVAERVMTDEDPAVQSAVGNMLMEASRLKADRVAEFLQEWKGKAPRQLLQNAATKLSSDQRKAVLGS